MKNIYLVKFKKNKHKTQWEFTFEAAPRVNNLNPH